MMIDYSLNCPVCKGQLKNLQEKLNCPECDKNYQIIDNIPDLCVTELGSEKKDMMEFFDEASIFYESTAYHAQLYQLYAGLPVFSERMVVFTNQQIIKEIKTMLGLSEGLVLDLACGTGMFGRSIALQNLSNLQLYSVDISWKMLKIARKYSLKDNLKNNFLIRANVEQLPFPDNYFDGVCCCGALQLFPHLEIALEEINRVLKVESKLVGMTYLKMKNFQTENSTSKSPERSSEGNKPVKKILSDTKLCSETKDVHFFDIDELGELFIGTGFDHFKYILHGHMIVFETEKIAK
jgi:ubiquinone/menaquinone biosynthesis C-methylase UbiE